LRLQSARRWRGREGTAGPMVGRSGRDEPMGNGRTDQPSTDPMVGWSGRHQSIGDGRTDQPSTAFAVGWSGRDKPMGTARPTNHERPPSLVGLATMNLWGVAGPTNHRRSLSLVRPPPIYRGWPDRPTIDGLRGRLRQRFLARAAPAAPGRPAGRGCNSGWRTGPGRPAAGGKQSAPATATSVRTGSPPWAAGRGPPAGRDGARRARRPTRVRVAEGIRRSAAGYRRRGLAGGAAATYNRIIQVSDSARGLF
jgi:hypothetical protein